MSVWPYAFQTTSECGPSNQILMCPQCILGAPVLVIIPPRMDVNTWSQQAPIVCLVKYTYSSLKLVLPTWYFDYFFFFTILITQVKLKQFSTQWVQLRSCRMWFFFYFFFFIRSLSSLISDPELTCWDKWVRDRRCWKLLSHIQAYILTLLRRFEREEMTLMNVYWTVSPPKNSSQTSIAVQIDFLDR